MAAIRWPRLSISNGRDRDGNVTTEAGRDDQSHAASTLTTASVSCR